MVSFERKIELEKQLKEAGNNLLNPLFSTDELLILLDKAESLLNSVDQAPPTSMQKALLPLMKALISDTLLRHSDMDVKFSVASCIIEITRITAPEAPYNDDRMKEIFELTVAAFENLSDMPSRCYTKAVSILDTVARVKLCMVMMDLECDELIIEMFQHFLKKLRFNHPNTVFLAMESIMTLVLDQSEYISSTLLSTLLASVRKENQKLLPLSWKLGENVITNCAHNIRPYLMEAVKSMNITLDDYSPIIASICRSEFDTLNKSGDHLVLVNPVFCGELPQAKDVISKTLMRNIFAATRENKYNDAILNIETSKMLECHSDMRVTRSNNASSGAVPDDFVSLDPVISGTMPDTIPKKGYQTPKSLMLAEEEYDCSMDGYSPQIPHDGNPHEKGVECTSFKNPNLKHVALNLLDEKPSCEINEIKGVSSISPISSLPGGCNHRRGPSKRKKKSMTTENTDPDSSADRLELKAQNLVKLAPSMDVRPKRISEAKTSGRKREKCSRMVEMDVEKIQAPPYLVMEKEERVQTGREKGLQQSNLVKRTSDDGMLDKGISRASSNQEMVSGTVTKARRGGNDLEKTIKTEPKRRRKAGKEMASELHCFGEELIGRTIRVWWPMEQSFYKGVVDSYDPIKKKHKVLYHDGDVEILNLKREKWEAVDCKGQETGLPKLGVALNVLPKQKSKIHASSNKSAKSRSSSERRKSVKDTCNANSDQALKESKQTGPPSDTEGAHFKAETMVNGDM